MGLDPKVENPLPFPLWLRIGFWICLAISIAVVLRRLLALARTSQSPPSPMAGLDQSFATHTALTLAHILPALLFVVLAPVIVFRRPPRPSWINAAFYSLGIIVAVTAYAMSAYSIGGWIERLAVFFFDTFFLISLVRAWHHRRRDNSALAHRWELRSIAILLGIATTRPVMGVFFATSRATHLLPQQFFGIAFWIGFSINVLVFELWVRSLDRLNRARHAQGITPHLRRAL